MADYTLQPLNEASLMNADECLPHQQRILSGISIIPLSEKNIVN